MNNNDSEISLPPEQATMRPTRNPNWLINVACAVLAGCGLFLALAGPSLSASREETIAALREHYASVPTMSGEFLQFGPQGEQSGGTFHIKRPGKVRFDYEDPSPVEVVSNGLAVMVVNNRLQTFDTYPLKNTPLKLLLDDKLEIDNQSILDIREEDGTTTIVLGDRQIFGNSVITLLFDSENFDLRQWTIKDAQGKETSVLVFNVEKNVRIPERMFQINKAVFRRTN